MRGNTAFSSVLVLSLAICAVCVMAGSADGSIIVYEGFQYGTAAASRTGADLLHGQPDGTGGDVNATGLGGTWQDSAGPGTNTDLFLASGSLPFGDLSTSGNHVRSDTNNNNDTFSRPVTGDLDSGSELWFSVLANKLQNNFSAAEGGMVIGNQTVNNSRILSDSGSTGLAGFGVAPTTAGNNWTAYAWNGSSQSVGDAVLNVATNGSETHLLVGKISFDTGTNGADEYTLYEYLLNGGSIVGGSLSQICSTMEVDVDQSTLDTLSLTRQVNTAYDEIRIGTSFDDVVVPEPATLGLLTMGGLFALRRRRVA